jgi:S-adenosylmethionine hydrolase
MARITLLTDFGTPDGYLGAMKGVLATQAPSAVLDDVTHAIPPGDIRKASLVVGRYWKRFPPGTVHLVVVDPGVGTPRRGLALTADDRLLVGPDNGVFSSVFAKADTWWCYSLASGTGLLPEPTSDTFHGRDWFAPAAALLATGTPPAELGDPVSDPVRIIFDEPRREGSWVIGSVVEKDRFGNLATDLPAELVGEVGEVLVAGTRVPFLRTYGDATTGQLIALVDSDGRVEVAVRDGSAATRLGLGVGGEVRVRTILEG